MGSEALLQEACELAFAVAREDAEADPPIEPPGDMRSFLYLARLPRRAIAVAQQAIEDNGDFRSRVADKASEADVGRAGYLWLHRPMGWASEFEELTRQVVLAAEEISVENEPSGEIRIATVSPIRSAVDDSLAEADESAGVFATANVGLVSVNGDQGTDQAPPDRDQALNGDIGADAEVGESAPYGGEKVDGDASSMQMVSGLSSEGDTSELDFEADAIESELTSLRGLVDRLAGERELVLASSGPDQNDGASAIHEGEVAGLQSDLESVRHELALAQSDLTVARQEREDAQRQQSDALRKQVELERELSSVRDARAAIENDHSEAQVSLISIEDKLTRANTSVEELERERQIAQSQLETMTGERNQLREDGIAVKTERDDLLRRLEEVREKTGGVDVGELTSSNRSLTQELEATSRELARMIAQVENYEEQIRVTSSRADTLKTEKIELSSRLADTDLALESTRTQHDALKGDSERLAAEVGALRAERDSLQTQLNELQESLSDVLGEQAESRSRNDSDRKSLNELRVERDVLLARMNDIEQADRNAETRVASLAKERDDLVTLRDDLISERGQLRGEAAAAASNRTQMQAKIDELDGRIRPMETELQAERRQREELANRLLELDETAASDARQIERLSLEGNEMRETLERLQDERVDAGQLKVERDNLQEQLRVAERRLEEEGDRHSVAVTDLNDRIGGLEGNHTTLEQQLAESRSELVASKNEYEEANRELARLRVELDRQMATIDSSAKESERQSDSLRKQLDEVEVQRVELSQRLADTERSLGESDRKRREAERAHDRSKSEADELRAAAAAVNALASPSQGLDSAIDAVPDELAEPDDVEAPHSVLDDANDPRLDHVFGTDDRTIDDGTIDDGTIDDGTIDDGTIDANSAEADGPAADVVAIDDRRVPSVFEEDERAEVTEGAEAERSSGDNELDEISQLISETVTTFDEPDGAEVSGVVPAVMAPPSVFDSGGDMMAASDDWGDGSSTARRMIEVPPEIADDEMAMAQFVVSSPDVVLLVEGDSVAKLGWPSLPIAQQRDALVTYLAELAANTGAAPDVVFDGRIGDSDSLPAPRSVLRIRLSTTPPEPAAALVELADAYPGQWPIALVTDDPNLAVSARERGAIILNNGQLLDLFIQ